MEETFYSALGVETDADDDAVRAAYRDAVKEHHPDVSDDPGAERRFKLLTTARDVLLDPDERARYDRIGHEAYVSAHIDAPNWSGADADGDRNGGRGGSESRGSSSSGGGTAAGTGSGNRAGRSGAADRAAWLGDDATGGPSTAAGSGSGAEAGTSGQVDDPTPGSRGHRAATGRRRHVRDDTDPTDPQARAQAAATGPGVDEPWQRASDAYTRSPAASRAAAAKSASTSLRGFLGALGPWLLIHLVFIASAVATAVFALTEANAYFQLSLPAFLVGLVLFGLVIGLSVLHLVSQVVS